MGELVGELVRSIVFSPKSRIPSISIRHSRDPNLSFTNVNTTDYRTIAVAKRYLPLVERYCKRYCSCVETRYFARLFDIYS